MLRSAVLVLSGNAAVSLLLLARSLVIARLIPVADYGIAATLALAMAVVEMLSAFGLAQQIVQAQDGDDPAFQATAHGFMVLRGVASAAALLLLAGPTARFLNTEEATWGYQAMALVPLMGSFVHFDVHRLSRHRRFAPMVAYQLVPALASLLAVWPLVLWLGDWRVMLGCILLQVALGTLTSHLVAERPFRLALDRARVAASLRFGWPLLLNGVLLFLVFNGDKLVVGRELGMEALAVFAMATTLTLTPTLVLARSVQSVFLPRLSVLGAAGDARFRLLALVTFESVMILALLLVLGTALLGGPVALLLLDERYLPLLPLLTAFAATQAVRVLKAAPAIVALSVGRTGNALWSNVVRVAALPAAWWIAATSGDLLAVVWVGLVAEVLGYAVALALLRRSAPGLLRATLRPHLAAAAFLAVAVAHALLRPEAGLRGLPGPWGSAALLAGFLAAALAMGELRRYLLGRRA